MSKTYREYIDQLIAEGKCPHQYGIKKLLGQGFNDNSKEFAILICINCKEEKTTNYKETLQETGGYFYFGDLPSTVG